MAHCYTYFERTMRHCHVRVIVDGSRISVYSEQFVTSFSKEDEMCTIYDSINEKDVLLIPFPAINIVAKAIRDLESGKDLY